MAHLMEISPFKKMGEVGGGGDGVANSEFGIGNWELGIK
jgi:hypothetical protein